MVSTRGGKREGARPTKRRKAVMDLQRCRHDSRVWVVMLDDWRRAERERPVARSSLLSLSRLNHYWYTPIKLDLVFDLGFPLCLYNRLLLSRYTEYTFSFLSEYLSVNFPSSQLSRCYYMSIRLQLFSGRGGRGHDQYRLAETDTWCSPLCCPFPWIIEHSSCGAGSSVIDTLHRAIQFALSGGNSRHPV